MTLEEILELDTDKLASLSDLQLSIILSPYFTKTRTPALPEKTPGKMSQQEKLVHDAIKANLANLDKFQRDRK